jgi:membrane protein
MLRVLRNAGLAWSRHNAPRLGAALAYYGILSLAPTLVLVLAISGAAFGRDAARGEIYWQVRDVAGYQIAAAVQTLLKSASAPRAGLLAGTLGFAVMMFGASGLFVELRDTLNFIWDAPALSGTGAWQLVRERFVAFGVVIGTGCLLTLSLAFTALVQARSVYSNEYLQLPAPILESANFVVSLAVTTLLFAMIYRIIPEVRVDWCDVAVGSILTALLFSAGKLLIGLYLGRAGVGSAYGAAGSLVVLLVWIYYSAQIFLFGAEFTYAWAQRRRYRSLR